MSQTRKLPTADEESVFGSLFNQIMEKDVKTQEKNLKILLENWDYRLPEGFEESDEYVNPANIVSLLINARTFDLDRILAEVLSSLGDESAANLLPPTRRNYPASSAAQVEASAPNCQGVDESCQSPYVC